jgi:hypothetical protein
MNQLEMLVDFFDSLDPEAYKSIPPSRQWIHDDFEVSLSLTKAPLREGQQWAIFIIALASPGSIDLGRYGLVANLTARYSPLTSREQKLRGGYFCHFMAGDLKGVWMLDYIMYPDVPYRFRLVSPENIN